MIVTHLNYFSTIEMAFGVKYHSSTLMMLIGSSPWMRRIMHLRQKVIRVDPLGSAMQVLRFHEQVSALLKTADTTLLACMASLFEEKHCLPSLF